MEWWAVLSLFLVGVIAALVSGLPIAFAFLPGGYYRRPLLHGTAGPYPDNPPDFQFSFDVLTHPYTSFHPHG